MSCIPPITIFDSGQAVDHEIECLPPASPDASVAIGLYSARRMAEKMHRAFDRNDGIDGGKTSRLNPRIRIILCDLERLIAYRRASRTFDVVMPGQYVRCAVGPLGLKAAHYGDDHGELVAAWVSEFVPEYRGRADLSTPVLKVDTIAEALEIDQDEVDANCLNNLVSVDRPPEVRAADERTRDRLYSENRRRARGAKAQSSRTLTRDVQRVATALKIGFKRARKMVDTSVIDLPAEIAKLDAAAACQKASAAGTNLKGHLHPTDFGSQEAPPSTGGLDHVSSAATATTGDTNRGGDGVISAAAILESAEHVASSPGTAPFSRSASTFMPVTVDDEMWTRLRAGAHAAALAMAELDDGFNRIWQDEMAA